MNSTLIFNLTQNITAVPVEQHLLGLEQGLQQGLAHIQGLLLVTLVANLLEMLLLSVPPKWINGHEPVYNVIRTSLRLIQIFLITFMIGLNYVDLNVAMG